MTDKVEMMKMNGKLEVKIKDQNRYLNKNFRHYDIDTGDPPDPGKPITPGSPGNP